MSTRPFPAAPLLLAAACLLAVSCSSAPKKTETVTESKNRAAEATDIGNAYFRQGRYDLALRFFTQALDYNTSVDNEEGIVQSSNSIGKVYMAVGSLDAAEEIFTRALTRSADGNVEPFFVSSNNLGELYLQKGEPAKALATFEQVLAPPSGVPAGASSGAQSGARSGGLSDVQRAVLYHNMGTAHKNLGDLVEAREDLEKSLAINLAHKLAEETAADYYMLASVDSKQGDLESAMKNAQLALAMDKKIENSVGIAMDLYALGIISSKRKDTAAAYDFFQRSYLVSTTLSMRSDMRKALLELISAADALDRKAEAENYRQALAELDAPP
jgi:tetratricopeptide (TPR) repeat protein